MYSLARGWGAGEPRRRWQHRPVYTSRRSAGVQDSVSPPSPSPASIGEGPSSCVCACVAAGERPQPAASEAQALQCAGASLAAGIACGRWGWGWGWAGAAAARQRPCRGKADGRCLQLAGPRPQAPPPTWDLPRRCASACLAASAISLHPGGAAHPGRWQGVKVGRNRLVAKGLASIAGLVTSRYRQHDLCTQPCMITTARSGPATCPGAGHHYYSPARAGRRCLVWRSS
jgi:hypothetical protein